jgi:hypothetical protein
VKSTCNLCKSKGPTSTHDARQRNQVLATSFFFEIFCFLVFSHSFSSHNGYVFRDSSLTNLVVSSFVRSFVRSFVFVFCFLCLVHMRSSDPVVSK